MPIINKNKYELDQNSFKPRKKSEGSKSGVLSWLFSNPSNIMIVSIIAVVLVLIIVALGLRWTRGTAGNDQRDASQPAVSVRKHSETTAVSEQTDESQPAESKTTETEFTETSEPANTTEPSEISAELVVDRAAINAEIEQYAAAQGITVYPIQRVEFPRIDDIDVSGLPYGQITSYVDADTFTVALVDGSGEVTVNLAGINCNPPGGADGLLAVTNWLTEYITAAEPPYLEIGANYVYLDYADTAPQMSDGSYNAYVWFVNEFDGDDLQMLNERMLIEGWAEPDHNTANKEYYEYFKVYPYVYSDIGA